MQIEQIHIEKFKSLKDVKIDLGRVNVFIGPNGVGKTAILEALGIISAVMVEKFDDNLLLNRGVRLGTPALYKYSSKGEATSPTISMSIKWKEQNTPYTYKFTVNAPIEAKKYVWSFSAETFFASETKIFGRSNRSREFDVFDGIKIPKERSMYSVLRRLVSDNLNIDWDKIDVLSQLEDYTIYNPNILMLRGLYDERTVKHPIGLYGGRLPEAVHETLEYLSDDEEKKSRFLDFCALNNWAKGIKIGHPTDSIVSSNVSYPRRVIRFTDRFMKEGRNILTSYDANEGILFSLFLSCLLFHKDAPSIFAVDNFDYGMNPRIAKESMKVISKEIVNTDRTALLATHNPLVLDGLDLYDDRIRLFVVNRDRNGATYIERIHLNEDLNDIGISLSQLWLTGRLGGMPIL